MTRNYLLQNYSPEMPTPAPETTTGRLQLLSSRREVRQSLNYGLCLRLLCNSTFLIVSVITLFSTSPEKEIVPVRIWNSGYYLQCSVYLVLVMWSEYKQRIRNVQSLVTSWYIGVAGEFSTLRFSIRGYSFQFVGHVGLMRLEFRNRNIRNLTEDIFFRDVSSFESYGDGDGSVTATVSTQTRVARRWDKVISGIWWVIGSTWMVFGSENLNHVAPRLFWLTLAFLTIDAFFAFIQYLLAVFLGGAVSFCFPCIFGIMYFWRLKEGASDADISKLPKYIFKVTNDDGTMVPMGTNGPDFSVERVCLTENAECCICLCHYDNGEQLHLLPCNHNFHAECIVKWLKLKAICPLCRYVIG